MDKNFVHYLVWLIPIRSLRDKIRWKIMYNFTAMNFCYWVNYQTYKNKVKNKKTFFVRGDWVIDEKDFYKDYFYNVIKNNYINDLEISYKPDIEIFGPVHKRISLEKSKAKIKIFFTGECVSDKAIDKSWAEYSDNCVNDVDLSIGFDRLDENKYKNYIRFPIWINYHFNTIGGGILNLNSTKSDIKKAIDDINNAKSKKNKFASLVASHDAPKIRTEIFNKVSKIGKVSCAGKLLHNDDTLKNDFGNNKIEYLKDFKFNICPENTISDGYITEKLFDSFRAGCIPIYSGDENIEMDLVNKNALLFYRACEDNSALLKEIEKLNNDDKLFDAFQNQIKINDSMVDYLWERREKILSRLESLINERLK